MKENMTEMEAWIYRVIGPIYNSDSLSITVLGADRTSEIISKLAKEIDELAESNYQDGINDGKNIAMYDMQSKFNKFVSDAVHNTKQLED